MKNSLEKYLLEAQGKDKQQIPEDNPYQEFGFDGDSKRLGWIRVVPFCKIEQRLKQIVSLIEGKEHFIFVGMGGSSNGIKSLLALFPNSPIYVLDSLDPRALEEIVIKIKKSHQGIDKTLVIPISKSGTTKETQLLAGVLRELFSNFEPWHKHFLWLADPKAFQKLDDLGWQGVEKLTIQFDGEDDIGGRFACPQTAIFYLPLFLLLARDMKKVERIYLSFNSRLAEIRQKADFFLKAYKDKPQAYFCPVVEPRFLGGLYSWVTQLFQESLGSKINGLAVKTKVSSRKEEGKWMPLNLELSQAPEPIVYLMCQMYFLQVFVAFYAAARGLNFVNQDFVEKYKQELKRLQGAKEEEAVSMDLEEVIAEVNNRVTLQQKFVDIILYFHADSSFIEEVKAKFSGQFRDKEIFVYIGSDWNHHSYQAAFDDKETFFILMPAANYKLDILGFSKDSLRDNVNMLKLISRATYLTIKDKAILCSFSA